MNYLIEQPARIEGRQWFFLRGFSHSGAAYGVHLRRRDVEHRLTAVTGPGKLVEVRGIWFWRTESSPSSCLPQQGV